MTSVFLGERKAVPPIGSEDANVYEPDVASGEKLEEMLESGKHFLEVGHGQARCQAPRHPRQGRWLSLGRGVQKQAVRATRFILSRRTARGRPAIYRACEFPKSLKDKNLWVLNPQNRYSWD